MADTPLFVAGMRHKYTPRFDVDVEEKEKPAPKSRAPTIDPVLRQDILTLVGLAERLYHLPGGKNGRGVIGQVCLRVRKKME